MFFSGTILRGHAFHRGDGRRKGGRSGKEGEGSKMMDVGKEVKWWKEGKKVGEWVRGRGMTEEGRVVVSCPSGGSN
jgi:hypothetical protein